MCRGRSQSVSLLSSLPISGRQGPSSHLLAYINSVERVLHAWDSHQKDPSADVMLVSSEEVEFKVYITSPLTRLSFIRIAQGGGGADDGDSSFFRDIFRASMAIGYTEH